METEHSGNTLKTEDIEETKPGMDKNDVVKPEENKKDENIHDTHAPSSYMPMREIANSFCIGDFTDNSLLFTGEEVVHIPRIASVSNKDGKNDTKAMKGMLELFEQLNFKLDAMAQWRSIEKSAILEAHTLMELGEYSKASSILRRHTERNQDVSHLAYETAREVWDEERIEILNRVLKVKGILLKLESLMNTLLDVIVRKTDENDRLREVVKSQHDEYSERIASAVAEASLLKSGIIELLRKYCPETVLNSKLEDDLIESLEKKLKSGKEEVNDLKERLAECKTEIEELKTRESDVSLVKMKNRLENSLNIRKGLEERTVRMSEAIRKLSEENAVLRSSLESADGDLKRHIQESRRKDATISRQRVLIQLFQEKLGGTCMVSIAELKRKKEQVIRQLAVEKDFIKKDLLRKEIADCDRRLSDFLKLQERRLK